MVKMSHGRLKPSVLIALQRIDALKGVRFDERQGLTIGAMARISETAAHPAVRQLYPALAAAAQVMANVQIRNMGTIAGNICNAAPSAETAPPLTVMGAQAVLTGPDGERRVGLDDFFVGPGLTVMKRGEIMTSILVPPPPPRSGVSYLRISARCGVDIAAVNVAAALELEENTIRKARIVLGATAPTPMRARAAEAVLEGREWTEGLAGEAAGLAANEAKPITDVRATASWRKRMVAVLTGRALAEAYRRASEG
jgi:carbon-monoxide dehydrogenase medium subunit